MTDPERLLTDPRLERPVLASLEAARDFAAVPGAKAATWQALLARLPGPPPGGSSGDPGGGPGISDPSAGFGAGGAGLSSLAGASLGMALKALAVGAGLGFLVAGTANLALERRAPDPPREVEAPAKNERRAAVEAPPALGATAPELASTARVAPRSPAAQVVAPESTSELTTTSTHAAASSAAVSSAAASSPATARFSEAAAPGPASGGSAPVASPARALDESRLTAAAHQALRSGDARQALVLLDRAARNFPNGLLVQEREALLIEALHRAGERRAAERRGRRFVAANPTSPHVARVRALLDE